MSIVIDPNIPNLRKSQWIISEDVNVEQNSGDIWRACANFMAHHILTIPSQWEGATYLPSGLKTEEE